MKTAEQLTQAMEFWKLAAQGDLSRFKEELETDPAHALDWGQPTFLSAAKLKVQGYVQHALGNGATVEQVRDMAQEHVRKGSRYPTTSTSPVSNYMGQCLLQAWAELLEVL